MELIQGIQNLSKSGQNLCYVVCHIVTALKCLHFRDTVDTHVPFMGVFNEGYFECL